MRALAMFALCAGAGVLLPSFAARHSASTVSARAPIDPAARWPVRFEANRGQSRRPAAFLGTASGQEWRFRLGSVEVDAPAPADASGRIRITWVDASPFRLEPLDPLPVRSHYVDDSAPASWARDVPNFGALYYRRVYRGIDVRFFGAEGRLGHDFHVAEGVDPRQIRMRFDGASALHVEGGVLRIERRDGPALVFSPPAAHQGAGAVRSEVVASYRLDERAHEVTFDLGVYDRARPLTIGVPGPGLFPR
jgi:hypothetical protein